MRNPIEKLIKDSEIDFSASPSILTRNLNSGKDDTYVPTWDCERYVQQGMEFWLQDPMEEGLNKVAASFLHYISLDILNDHWSDPRQPMNMAEVREAVVIYVDAVIEHLQDDLIA